MSTATKRIREAEKTVEQARETLEKAEAGLFAAERVAESVDEVRSHPVRKFLMLVSIVGIIVFVVLKQRGDL